MPSGAFLKRAAQGTSGVDFRFSARISYRQSEGVAVDYLGRVPPQMRGAVMPSKQSRKEAIKEFKERKPFLGIFAIRCTSTGHV